MIHSEDRTKEECCQSSLICEKEDFYRKTTKNVGLQFAHMLNSFFGPPSILYAFVSRLVGIRVKWIKMSHHKGGKADIK